LVVVRPGDSLWSISSEQLGPNASPQEIATGVERIYALNQNRIGGDPNLIFPGQKFLLPAVGERSRAEASRAVSPTPEATKPAASGPTSRATKSETERATKSETEQASTTEVGKTERKAGKTSDDPVVQPVALPTMPPTQIDTPKVGSLSETDDPSQTDGPSPLVSFGRTAHSLLSSATSAVVGLFPQDDHFAGRRLVGLAIIVLTLLVAALMAWKMPLKRNLDGPEAWGIPTGYPTAYTGYYARYDTQPSEVTDRYEYPPGGAPVSPVVEADSGGFGVDAPAAVKNGRNGAEMIAAIMHSRRRSLRGQARSSRRLPRGVVAAGAHNPRVSRHVRDAGLRDAGLRQAARPRIRPRIRPRHSSAKGGRL
jgi:LysM repeat protein